MSREVHAHVRGEFEEEGYPPHRDLIVAVEKHGGIRIALRVRDITLNSISIADILRYTALKVIFTWRGSSTTRNTRAELPFYVPASFPSRISRRALLTT